MSKSASNSKAQVTSHLPSQEQVLVETLSKGQGRTVQVGDFVLVHYEGSLLNGQVFGRSEEPFVACVGVGQLISGWDMAIPGMTEGTVAKLTIPPSLAYGDLDLPGIPPNSTLVFKVEILQILN